MLDPKIQELAETLQGTPLSLSETCASLGLPENLSREQAEELDSIVFECACCGWWCGSEEANEIAGELLCEECKDEEP